MKIPLPSTCGRLLVAVLNVLAPACRAPQKLSPPASAWDQAKLAQAMTYAREIGSYALIVQTGGTIVASHGDLDRVSRVHSVRKAILSALVFQHLDSIDLDATLLDLGIDDDPDPLTMLQRSAKVIHLLKSTSGINHATAAQSRSMQVRRDRNLGATPNAPGTRWAYNNWDYAALTTVFEQETGTSISQAFEEGIAKPLGMKGHEVFYRRDPSVSIHAKAGFRLSTRDMAKFGQLFLNRGTWDGHQLIPREWIEKITRDTTETVGESTERARHGYLWWIPARDYAGGLPEGTYVATGKDGQRIVVIPNWDTVITNKTLTEGPIRERTAVRRADFEKLVRKLAGAREPD